MPNVLNARIDEELKNAMRAGETLKVSTLRLLRSAVKNAEIEKRGELSEEEIVKIIAREVKKRKESIALFEKGGRPEKASAEQNELKILAVYLPAQANADEVQIVVRRVIRETGAASAADIGKVMGKAMQELRGKADGNEVKRVATALLTGH